MNGFAGEVAMQVHLAEADGVAFRVSSGDGGDRLDVGLVGDGCEGTDGGFHGFAEVGGIHGHSDVHGAEVAADVTADM